MTGKLNDFLQDLSGAALPREYCVVAGGVVIAIVAVVMKHWTEAGHYLLIYLIP